MIRGTVLLLLAVLLVFGLRWFVRARSETASNACVNYLRQLDGVKQQWAIDNKISTNAVPTWQDLSAYLPDWERGRGLNRLCPQGGSYVLGPVCKRPTCSIGGYGHAVPE